MISTVTSRMSSVVPLLLLLFLPSTLKSESESAATEEERLPAFWPMTQDEATELQYQAAQHYRYPLRQNNSLDMHLMLIPPGTFQMGSTEEEREWANSQRPSWWSDENAEFFFGFEQPQHEVTLTEPFLMSATEVTIGQFQEFVRATGYETVPQQDGRGGMYYEDGKQEGPEFIWASPKAGWEPSPDHPVTQITYQDAVAFCEWLTEKEGRPYRLPTEAEWEWAARAGSDQIWYFGDDAADADDHIVMRAEHPAPVASKEPNGFGLFDMYGNVWEMTSDFASQDYYANSPLENPTGPESGNARTRRGGSYAMSPGAEMRSAYRKPNKAGYRGLHVGFRVVADLPIATNESED